MEMEQKHQLPSYREDIGRGRLRETTGLDIAHQKLSLKQSTESTESGFLICLCWPARRTWSTRSMRLMKELRLRGQSKHVKTIAAAVHATIIMPSCVCSAAYDRSHSSVPVMLRSAYFARSWWMSFSTCWAISYENELKRDMCEYLIGHSDVIAHAT